MSLEERKKILLNLLLTHNIHYILFSFVFPGESSEQNTENTFDGRGSIWFVGTSSCLPVLLYAFIAFNRLENSQRVFRNFVVDLRRWFFTLVSGASFTYVV